MGCKPCKVKSQNGPVIVHVSLGLEDTCLPPGGVAMVSRAAVGAVTWLVMVSSVLVTALPRICHQRDKFGNSGGLRRGARWYCRKGLHADRTGRLRQRPIKREDSSRLDPLNPRALHGDPQAFSPPLSDRVAPDSWGPAEAMKYNQWAEKEAGIQKEKVH